MAKTLVVFLESDLLLSAGVRSLLMAQESLDVVGLTFNGRNDFPQAIEGLTPDVIIIDEEVLISHMSDVLRFLRNYPRMRTIIFGLGDNVIQVCDTRQILVRKLDDFLALVGSPALGRCDEMA